jgi:hypothetical protein
MGTSLAASTTAGTDVVGLVSGCIGFHPSGNRVALLLSVVELVGSGK